MFTTFFDTVLPFIGDFCGLIAEVFSQPFSDVVSWFSYGGALGYYNLFNGVRNVNFGIGLLEPIGGILSVVGSSFDSWFNGFVDLPFWTCVLIISLFFSAFVWVLTTIFKLFFA